MTVDPDTSAGGGDGSRVSDEALQRALIEAVYDQRLSDEAVRRLARPREAFSSDALETLHRAVNTCTNIAGAIETECERFLGHLRDRGVTAAREVASVGGSPQVHKYTVRISEADLPAAYEVACAQGYVPQRGFSPGALDMLQRSAASTSFMRMDDATTRMTLRWRTNVPPWGPLDRLRPGPEDLAAIALHRAAWPAYSIVRPLRRLIHRGRPGAKDAQAILGGGFLGTPTSLIPPLLEAVSLTAGDTLLDVGCGDGRIVAEAHRRYGCRARGVERSERLAKIARETCASGLLSGAVDVLCGEASEVDYTDASVVFMFLPKSVLAGLLPEVLMQVPVGARIVAHEQDRLAMPIEPNESRLVLADSAITVAHVWRRDRQPAAAAEFNRPGPD